jgi:integrase/recombinase XerD
MDHTTISITELIGNVKRQLKVLGYAEATINQYSLKWNHFSMYAEQKGTINFSEELGNAFLADYFGIKAGINLSASQVFKARTVAILGEFWEHGCFLRCHHKRGKQAPPQFRNILKKYESLQFEEEKISKRTINGKKIILVRFLTFLDKQGLNDISGLTALGVLAYLQTLEKYRSNSRSGILFTLRNFLLFLHSDRDIKEPLHELFPVIFSNKFERLPSYYSTDEVRKILYQVDRNTEYGRRDYLILLLAVQLGMRAGDIRQLKFEDIKWSRITIEFVQQKTNKSLQLPLTEELKYALADYMKNSRPKVDDPHIFIRHRAPFQPFTLENTFYQVLNKYMDMAGTQLNGRKHGLHSMRHYVESRIMGSVVCQNYFCGKFI